MQTEDRKQYAVAELGQRLDAKRARVEHLHISLEAKEKENLSRTLELASTEKLQVEPTRARLRVAEARLNNLAKAAAKQRRGGERGPGGDHLRATLARLKQETEQLREDRETLMRKDKALLAANKRQNKLNKKAGLDPVSPADITPVALGQREAGSAVPEVACPPQEYAGVFSDTEEELVWSSAEQD